MLEVIVTNPDTKDVFRYQVTVNGDTFYVWRDGPLLTWSFDPTAEVDLRYVLSPDGWTQNYEEPTWDELVSAIEAAYQSAA